MFSLVFLYLAINQLTGTLDLQRSLNNFSSGSREDFAASLYAMTPQLTFVNPFVQAQMVRGRWPVFKRLLLTLRQLQRKSCRFWQLFVL